MNLYLWSLNSTLTRFILKSETETFVIILVSVQLGTKKKIAQEIGFENLNL